MQTKSHFICCLLIFIYKTWSDLCVCTFWTSPGHFNSTVIILITVIILVTIIVIRNFHTVTSLVYSILSAHFILVHILFYILLFFIFILIFFTYFFPYLYLCIFSCVCIPYNCTVHGADLTYISLLVIFCIIVYVINTNLEVMTKSWLKCNDFSSTKTGLKIWKTRIT